MADNGKGQKNDPNRSSDGNEQSLPTFGNEPNQSQQDPTQPTTSSASTGNEGASGTNPNKTQTRTRGKGKKFQCGNCRETFNSHKKYQTHRFKRKCGKVEEEPVPELPKPKEYNCHFCAFTCRNREGLQSHADAQHPMPNIEEILQTETETETHKCRACGILFQTRDELKQHLYAILEPKKCQFCEDVIGSVADYILHCRTYHGKDIGIICPGCDQPFYNVNALDLHGARAEICHPEFKCPLCGKGFGNAFINHYHVYRKLCQEESNLKGCPFCKYIVKSVSDFIDHCEMYHLNERIFKCPFCDEEFEFFIRLQSHGLYGSCRRVELECPYCNRRTFDNVTVFLHHVKACRKRKTKTRSDTKGKRRRRRRKLEVEMKCGFCQMEFSSGQELTSHGYEVHNTSSVLKCEYCDLFYCSKTTLLTHMNNKHPESGERHGRRLTHEEQRAIATNEEPEPLPINEEPEPLPINEEPEPLPTNEDLQDVDVLFHLRTFEWKCGCPGAAIEYISTIATMNIPNPEEMTPCGVCRRFGEFSLLRSLDQLVTIRHPHPENIPRRILGLFSSTSRPFVIGPLAEGEYGCRLCDQQFSDRSGLEYHCEFFCPIDSHPCCI